MSRNAYNKLSNYATTVSENASGVCVVYHATTIVRYTHNVIVLCTGGYYTVTTKKKMNQASHQFNLGYSVYQRKGEWYVNYQGQTYQFDDNNTVTLQRYQQHAA